MAAEPITTGRQFFPVGTPVRYQDCLAAEPMACVETLDGPLQPETFNVGDAGTYVGRSRDYRASSPVVAVRVGERDLLVVMPVHALAPIEPADIEPAKLTCPTCDWTDEPTGDDMTDRMLVAGHEATHVDPADSARRARALNRSVAEYERGD